MKWKILLCLLAMCSCMATFAQTLRISGSVSSSPGGFPIPGASIRADIGNVATISDADGDYQIAVPESARFLIFSSVGYKTTRIEINKQTSVNVLLESALDELSEVVVVGYGTQSKTEFTGSAARISGEVVKNVPIQSFDQGLQGQVAGVSIASPNGVLNNPPVIRIRGINSISLSSYPLIVVDGVPINTGSISNSSSVPNNPLGDINPADIESIDVLKDAASTSIYGSRAAAGVLLITTKRGKEGTAKVNYDVWGSISKAARLPKLLDATQYTAIKNEAVNNSKILGGNADNDQVAAELFFPAYRSDGSLVNTNWYDHIYRTGKSQNHSLNISGGTEKTSYYFSGNFSDQEGFLVDNRFNRKGLRFNIDHQAISWLKLRGGATYNTTFNQSFSSGTLPSSQQFIINAARAALVLPPNVLALNEDGTYNISPTTGYIGLGNNRVTTAYYNPLALFDYSRYTSENDHFLGNVGATIKLLKHLDFNTTYALDRIRTENISFLSPAIGSSGYPSNGSATNVAALRNNWNWNATLNYDQRFGDKHHVGLLVGRDIQHFETNIWGANATQASDPFFEYYQGGWSTVVASGNTLGERSFVSTFGRITYDFKSRYFFTGNFRRDGNSTLAPGRKYGNFGGISGGWALSEEAFYRASSLLNIVNNIKLRASWGRVGNGNLESDYASLNLFNPGLYGDVPTWAISQAGNNLLTWETSKQTNIGADLSFFNDRYQLELTYFYNDVNGLILETPQAASKGIPSNSIVANVGSLYNKGIELGINGRIIDKKDFHWNASLNFTHVKNRVTSLADGNADIVTFTHTAANSNNITRVGYSVGSLYGAKTDGVNPENGRRIFINGAGERVQYSSVVAPGESNWTYLDGSPAPAISSSDYYLLANALPTFYGGFTNNFSYKALDLSVHFTYAGGNYLMNGTKATLRDQTWYNNYTDILDRWTTPGQQTDIPRLVYNDIISSGNSFPISANVEKADFIRLQNLILGYRLPSQALNRIGIATVRIYAQASNLFLITGYTGTDPELSVNGNNNTNPGIERNSVGQGRTFSLGLNIGF